MRYTREATQQVSRCTVAKRALAIFLLVFALVIGMAGVVYFVQTGAKRGVLEDTEQQTVELQRKYVIGDIVAIASDLMFLSGGRHLDELLHDRESLDPEVRATLSEEYLRFSAGRKWYDQIRLLDEDGMETVRVNFNSGSPSVVPESELQNKKDRYYFADTLCLSRGEVFVSPLDLNIERGEIEQPLKPMIRFGTPVFDEKGSKRGIVLLNYLGAHLLDRFSELGQTGATRSMLLNSDGYWLKGPNPEDEWGFMYKDREDRVFGEAYPKAWREIQSIESGQFETAEGLFTFTTVYPLLEGQKSSTGAGEAFVPSAAMLEAEEYYWKVVSHVPADTLYAERDSLRGWIVPVLAVLAVILGAGSWRLAWSGVVRRQAEKVVRKANADLAFAKERAEAADRLKSVFLATMSHELRTPLNSIIGFTGIVLQGLAGSLTEEQRRQLGMVEASAYHLLDLINDVLDISKVEAGQLEITRELFDMREAIEKVVAAVAPLGEKKGLALVADVAPEVGEIASDRRRVEQILINLLNNAIKFTQKGEVRIACQVRRGQLETRVIDTGIGIKPENMDKLFEAFQQIETGLPREHEGTGLGLSICKKLVEALGGEIRAESAWGVGSTFTFTLPVSAEEEDET